MSKLGRGGTQCLKHLETGPKIIVRLLYIIARRAYCVERLQKSMCVRPCRPCCPSVPSVRPCRPKIKKIWDFSNNLIQRDASDLVTINRVLALVTPSSATNSGSVRDVNLWIWSESLFWSLSTQKALRATLPCWCYLVRDLLQKP